MNILNGVRINFLQGVRKFCSKNVKTYRPTPGQMPSMLDIGSRAIFNADHDTLRESVRRLFREEMAPMRKKWEQEGTVSRSAWLRMGELGYLGIDTPADKGGHGGSFLHSAIIMEEQSLTDCLGSGFVLHSDIIIPYIMSYGSEEQIKKYLPDMLSGKKIGAIAMTEPQAGSDLQGIRTRAIRNSNGDYILNGSKCFISNGHVADVVIVVAITDPKAKSPAHGISLLIVDADAKGFSKGKPIEKIGLKTHTVQHKLAEMKTDICVARAFIDQCIEMYTLGKLDSATASMAKYWASELEVDISSRCVQLHGGWGYVWETPIARAYATARLQPLYGGSNEIMRELIAREIVGGKKK